VHRGGPQPTLAAKSEKRQLISTILDRATWKDGMLAATLLEPLHQLRRSNSLTTSEINQNGDAGRKKEIWLPIVDAFRTFAAWAEPG
jgi:hypothetical protein